MGKGDRKTKKGKIAMGTFGVSRPYKVKAKSHPKKQKPLKKK
ncbi:30S ribosomal protein THX [uncultured Roseivirga sp.]|nr:30S ribosomal protein THX [uncultured Roseivirga sp.]PWL31806.1 MAG: 30S ribosomal protein THX [Roseivirga sp. XM-24bin3]